jgi:N-acetylglutamate synthase-like GNAT family acetyltransferase
LTARVKIRDGCDADGQALDALLHQLHPTYDAGLFRSSRLRSGTRTFVSEAEDGSVVGLLVGAFVDQGIAHESCGYLEELVVDEARRGELIGERLVEAWKAWLRDEGIALGFVSTMPGGPQAFSERCGFRSPTASNGPWLCWSELAR